MSEQKKAPAHALKQGGKPGFLSSLFKKSPAHASQLDAKQARANGAKAVFLAVDSVQGEELVKQCGAMMDKVIRL